MRVLVTGVAGFLGSHLADRMLARGHEVVGVDSMIGGDRDNVPEGVDFFKGHCEDQPLMRLLCRRTDLVYHCAALAYEGLSVFSPALVAQNIFGGAVGVFSGAIASGSVRRIVHCSSMARYGGIPAPFKEDDGCRPQDPYGIAKVASEAVLRNLAAVHGVEFAIAVPHNIIGPRQKYDDPYRNVASIMANLMLQGRQPVVYGDGSQTRCFSFVEDCVGCLESLGTLSSAAGRVFNIGPDEGAVSVLELARTLARILAWPEDKLAPVFVPGRPQEVREAFCSSDRARAELGYATKTTLEDGLRALVEGIRARGPKPFAYHLPVEIENALTPKTWSERLF